MIAFAESTYGQNVGELYSHANVSGPTEFGELPLEDRLFWNAFLDEKLRRLTEETDDHDATLESISNSSGLGHF